jgi:hypothetical protein
MVACDKGARSFDSVTAIASALEDGGVDCQGLQQGDTAKLVKESGSCAFDGGELEIYLFDGTEPRDKWVSFGHLTQRSLVIGPNWIVSSPNDEKAGEVKDAIGGDLDA